MSNNAMSRPIPPAPARTWVALGAPFLIGLILTGVIQNLFGASGSQLGSTAIFLSIIGIISWLIGVTWYGFRDMGLRGGRPMFSGSGFAFLGWVAVLIIRLFLVDIDQGQFLQGTLWQTFLYLLLFEAFAVQLWLFGIFFRGMADLRGGVSAAVMSGIVFAVFGFYYFLEAYEPTLTAFLYFLVWGIFYGIIRLRTGSIVGIVLVQAMQSLTVWFLFPTPQPVTSATFSASFYLYMTVLYLILIWRLWPKESGDYRI